MRAFFAVAAREVAERKLVLLFAPVLAVIPFLLGYVPYLRDLAGTADTWAGSSIYLTLAYAFPLSLSLGGSLFTRELTERRLSFYFARPLSPFTIWAGK